MASITLTQLIAQVRQRANLEASPYITDSEQSITDAELINWINEGASELHEDFTLTPEHYKITLASREIATGNTFDVPSDMFKIRLLEKYTSSSADGYSTLEEFALHEHNQFGGSYDSFFFNYSAQPRWCLLGTQIHIEPASQAQGNYRIWYAPEYVNLTSGDDVLEMPANWHAYVVVYAAIQARIKKNVGSTAELELQLSRLKSRIQSASARRGQGRQIKNVRPSIRRVIR